ncbi:hypothetical protein BACCAP_02959 [Pseudoflavonifractor capillosus ATCC 29799]|uniref:Uncharacterized protein n=1 Tax=Pseudoflavonifractor capillosus ATCC 29799 TaxID=411467 RepID=A6NXL3_9FIRM|nr:hypothetical protein BACCAP_02959 [Pseudoflavonifractor capillosus ATCC 29799]
MTEIPAIQAVTDALRTDLLFAVIQQQAAAVCVIAASFDEPSDAAGLLGCKAG